MDAVERGGRTTIRDGFAIVQSVVRVPNALSHGTSNRHEKPATAVVPTLHVGNTDILWGTTITVLSNDSSPTCTRSIPY